MKQLSILVLLLFFIQSFGQKKTCFCEKDSLMSEAVNCDTIFLKNHSKLYWQLNCNRIWLTLENAKKTKIVIDEPDVNLYEYTYRLGFHLIREYKNSILFRTDCGASGPCSYILIDKTTGKRIQEFGQLICIDTDSQYRRKSHQYPFDFIVYLDEDVKGVQNLVVYYIGTKKTLWVPFKEELTAAIPQEQFDTMTVKNNVLSIFYETNNNPKKSIKINLTKPDKKNLSHTLSNHKKSKF